MHEDRYNALEKLGLIKSKTSPFMEHLTQRGKKAWSQVEQSMFDLSQVDFSKADRDCNRCNGTGILRNSKIGGILTTILCSCLAGGRDG